jgi:hypothetical protein
MTRVLVTFLFGLVLLMRPLVVPAIIFVAIFVAATLPFMGIRAIDRLQTPAISHCMARVRMSRVGTLKDLGVGILIIALGHWFDCIDGIIHYSVAALPPPKIVLLTPITIIIAVVMVIIASIITVVVTMPIIAPVIRVAI